MHNKDKQTSKTSHHRFPHPASAKGGLPIHPGSELLEERRGRSAQWEMHTILMACTASSITAVVSASKGGRDPCCACTAVTETVFQPLGMQCLTWQAKQISYAWCSACCAFW